ncbi:lipoprotein-releasing ABC transporter permease subunit [bacterium]|nr:lipoprotein-releasing ABC transporter permease subunit [bacterium]MBU4310589.1 lipoprotein-releasing ABC transporter permease subunit [bacterium]MCG2676703.1 lipoprotein-releasing ABC transporter permease subunit [bacterium]MCG2677488.1 lipoprotein-releasing ABC transporter permease subunit [bacterium]
MRYPLFIALRYLRGGRGSPFLSVITLISIGGVTLGVAALIITLSVMNGFHEDLRNKIVGTNAHLVILKEGAEGLSNYKELGEEVEKMEHVLATSPFIFGQAMIISSQSSLGVVIRGIDISKEIQITDLDENIIKGKLKDFGPNSLILGKELAMSLGADVNDLVKVISPKGIATPVGMKPKFKSFKVAGIFDTGMYEYDSTLAYVTLDSARALFGMGNVVTGLQVKIDDIYQADKMDKRIQKELGYPYWVRNWMELNSNLFAALRMEKITMTVILVLIILVAAFNIASVLIMKVIRKTKEIGILKAMGAQRKSIMSIFILEGLFIGLVGTLLGTFIGSLICFLQDKYHLVKLPGGGEVYYISILPISMRGNDILLIILATIGISLLATIYPAWRGARLDPVEAIRYE